MTKGIKSVYVNIINLDIEVFARALLFQLWRLRFFWNFIFIIRCSFCKDDAFVKLLPWTWNQTMKKINPNSLPCFKIC